MLEKTENDIGWIECGSGETIIFLHAMAGSKTAWQPQIEHFSQQYRCIAWDMPGFGDSEALHDTARMPQIVEVLHAFVVETLALEKAHFVGLSVGGMILQHFAAQYPALVESMVIMDSSPKFGFDGGSDPQTFVTSVSNDLKTAPTVRDFCTAMINAIVAPKCKPDVRSAAIDAMARGGRDGLLFAAHLIAEHDALAKLPLISAPALVMAGENDAETPPAYAEKIASELKNAQVKIVPDAGHIVNLENPEQVNLLLAAFWGSLNNGEMK